MKQSSSNQTSRELSPDDLAAYLRVANTACDGAKEILNSHFGHLRKVEEKFQAGLVSEADRESEKFIVQTIQSSFPDHEILGEESGLSKAQNETGRAASGHGSKSLWMIDPLDGTTNYIHQFPYFCISIGLEVNGELVLGVVDAPKLGVRFSAVKGGGAFCRNTVTGETEKIHVSTRKEMRDGLFATGFSSYDNSLDVQLELVSRFIKSTRGIRRAGAAALDLCFVAQGMFDVFWEKHLSPWDTAAGVVIAREAGGVVTDMEGRSYDPRLPSIVCGQPVLHAEALSVMEQIQRRTIRED